MRIENPQSRHIPDLRKLWKEAFGDTEDFLDQFFSLAFSPDRCRCVLDGDCPVAMLYWFDEFCRGQKMAYLYAVATRKDCQGHGLCRKLMEQTHRELHESGYAGTILIPASQDLAAMYGRMGYAFAGGAKTISCTAGASVSLRQVGVSEYHRLREKFLPAGSVVLEEQYLPFLDTQAEFYAGEDFLLAVQREETTLDGVELLGNPAVAPGILTALGAESGTFRIPGNEPYAMYHSLDQITPPPTYFGLGFQ